MGENVFLPNYRVVVQNGVEPKFEDDVIYVPQELLHVALAFARQYENGADLIKEIREQDRHRKSIEIGEQIYFDSFEECKKQMNTKGLAIILVDIHTEKCIDVTRYMYWFGENGVRDINNDTDYDLWLFWNGNRCPTH